MSGRLFTLRFCPVKTVSMNLGTLPFNPAWTLDVLFVNSNPIIRVGRPKFSQYNQKQTSNDKISLHVSIAATKLLKSTWPDGVMVAFQTVCCECCLSFFILFPLIKRNLFSREVNLSLPLLLLSRFYYCRSQWKVWPPSVFQPMHL